MDSFAEQRAGRADRPRPSFRSNLGDNYTLLSRDSVDLAEQDLRHLIEMTTIEPGQIFSEPVDDAMTSHVSHQTESNHGSRRSNSLSSTSSSRASIRSNSNHRKHKTSKNPFRLLSSKYLAWQMQSRYQGWRMGVLFSSCMAGVVLCCNIALLVAGSRNGFDSDGVADLMRGEGDTITTRNTMFHVLLNILSTILLAGSNYTMQVLSSPTRKEIDDVHKRGDWLEIGLLSARNMRKISRKRAAICAALAISSVPLHLFYNASIFKLLTRHASDIFAVDTQSPTYEWLLENKDQYAQLSNDEWRPIYDKEDVSSYGTLYLIVDQIAFNSTDYPVTNATWEYFPFRFWKDMEAFNRNFGRDRDWMRYCNGASPREEVKCADVILDEPNTRVTRVLPTSIHISHGLATKVSQQSRVQISLHFLIVVIAFNIMKLILMMTVLVSDRSDYLVTLGDAAASFLERPDVTTDGKCLLWEGDLRFKWSLQPRGVTPATLDSTCYVLDSATNTWQPQQLKLSSSVSLGRSVAYIFSAIGIIIFILVFFTQVRYIGFEWGSASEATYDISPKVKGSSKDTLLQAWFANVPQVFLSIWYVSVNAVCTSMSSALEWNNLGKNRKGLRVSNPKGNQRSTYFLQLPYRWAAPLIVLSGLLHWLLSQTIFLVRLDYYFENEEFRPESSKAAVGVSFSSLAALLAIGFAMMLAVSWIGYRPLHFNVPPAKSCSLVISAACHPLANETDPHLKRVKWGATKQVDRNDSMHCSLSSKSVKEPEIGKTYI